MLHVFGLSAFAFFFGGALWMNAGRWRYLAKSYGGEPGILLEKRSLQSAVLLGLGGFNSLKGILIIGLHETGVSLRILAPFSVFHSPLFIPYEDIRGWKTTWYLDAKSTELEFLRAPAIKMVVPADQAQWIRKYAGHQMVLRDVDPPLGKAGRGWHAFSVVHACIGLVMIVWVTAILLLR